MAHTNSFFKIVMMKTQVKKHYFLLCLIFLVLVSSCRSEDDLSIDPSVDDTIAANSTLANLMSRVVLNDGSIDNIIDNASNLSIQLPVTVTVNGIELEITIEDAYQVIEDIFNLSDSDTDTLVISYPITIILPDFSTVIVNSDLELQAYADNEDDDDDIECIDFQYPITISYFNENADAINTISIDNDNEMFDFCEILDELAAVTINFPVIVIFFDGTTQTTNNVEELESAIENADNTCDEDDNNDFDDDECESCSTGDLNAIFAECTEWTVDKLFRDNNNLVNAYVDYTFTFNNDGTIDVTENLNTYNGTWEAIGAANNIVVTISITDLPDFNDTWNLTHINTQANEKKVELRKGVDRLRFGSDCNEGDITVDVCDNPQLINLPFRMIDVAGDFCWEVSDSVLYFNSWGVDFMEVNGLDITNQWIDSSLPNWPEAIDGKYYVHYIASTAIGAGIDSGIEFPDYVSCTNPTEISLPFSFTGVGVHCWVTSEDISSINSWESTIVEVNGVNLTNQYLDATSINFPDKIDGKYFIRFVSTFTWSHFEAAN